jgi:ABC-type multidrug transport system ATPase subunit
MEILHNASNISTDERKKLLLARVLYHDGDLFCLDYCFDDWYPLLSERIFRRIVREYLKKKTIFYSTSFNRLIKSCDLVLYFENGEIKQQGRYTDLLCDFNKGFFKLIIGEKKENWRRQVIGKLLDGLKMNNSSIIMGNHKVFEDSLLSLEESQHNLAPDQVQSLMSIVAKYLTIKVKRSKLGQFSKTEKLIVGTNLTKEIV